MRLFREITMQSTSRELGDSARFKEQYQYSAVGIAGPFHSNI